MTMTCFIGVLSLPLAVSGGSGGLCMVDISRRAVPCRPSAEQGEVPGFLVRYLKSTWSILQGFWLSSQCRCSRRIVSYPTQQAERGTLVPVSSAPCAGQMGQTLTLCISFSLQMARPIQVKPADSESRGGSCHLSLFLLWWLCGCEGIKQRDRVLTWPSPSAFCVNGCLYVAGIWGWVGGRGEE